MMFPSKTVFVLGAGASQEVGLPVGSELKKTISTKLDLGLDAIGQHLLSSDPVISNTLNQRYYAEPDALNRYLEACGRIRDGVILSPSIDDFIDNHREDKDIAMCGKLAIARSILEAERGSTLFYERTHVSDTINFESVAGTWYTGFYQLLTQGVPKTQIASLFENVTVISFNYDRCLEHFLVHAIAANYHVTIDEARRLLVDTLTIFHPYGSVGPYFGPTGTTVAFGLKGLPEFDKVARNLKTYTEQIEDTEGLKKIRSAVVEAEVVVFLGTAFHSNNMALLANEPSYTQAMSLTKTKRVYATRKGISDADLSVVCDRLSKMCAIPLNDIRRHTNMHFAQECRHLFDKYRMSLRE